jgi:hypothetical protein
LLPTWALGQCCSPGNPIGGSINPGVNQAGRGQVLLGYRYGYAGRYFEGDQATEATFIRAGDYQHLSVTGTFGLSERLTLAVETGYVLYKRQWYVAGVRPAELRGSGLTDLTALVRVNWLRDEARGWEFTMELGPKFPLGSYRQAVDGIRLPRDLQPSTGAMELVHTTFLQKAFLAQKYRLFLLSRFELKAQNPEGYRYGPWLALAAFASYAPFARWTLLGQLRQEWRGRDSRPFTGQGFDLGNGREAVPPTGSYKLFAAPQVGFQPTPDWQVTLLAEWPLYQHYQEQQLATSFSALIGVAYWWGKG